MSCMAWESMLQMLWLLGDTFCCIWLLCQQPKIQAGPKLAVALQSSADLSKAVLAAEAAAAAVIPACHNSLHDTKCTCTGFVLCRARYAMTVCVVVNAIVLALCCAQQGMPYVLKLPHEHFWVADLNLGMLKGTAALGIHISHQDFDEHRRMCCLSSVCSSTVSSVRAESLIPDGTDLIQSGFNPVIQNHRV